MKNVGRLSAIVVLPILALVPFVFSGGGWVTKRCEKDSISRACRVHLALGDVSFATAPDGSLAVAAPVINDGRLVARSVKVSSVSVSGGGRLLPISLPAELGDLAPNNRSVFQAHLDRHAVDGVIILKGVYLDWGQTKRFTLRAPVTTDRVNTPTTVEWIR